MNTFVNKKTGERLPEYSHDWWFRIDQATAYRKSKFEIFERGKGWRKGKLADWSQEEIPDLCVDTEKEGWKDEWKTYMDKYGLSCATHVLPTCEVMKGQMAYQIINPPKNMPTKEDETWFSETFDTSVYTFTEGLTMSFLNKFSFDILKFDRWLRGRYPDYPREDEDGSMRGFIEKHWDKATADHFVARFLKSHD